MIKRAFKYFFPGPSLQQRLPRLPTGYSSPRGKQIDPEMESTLHLLIGYGLARTQQDALRLLDKHPDLSLTELITKKRKRRQVSRWQRAKERLKALW